MFDRAIKGIPVMKQFYAHSTNSQGQRHRPSDHLKEVAILSKKFVDKFGAGDQAYYVGLWRDLGNLQKKVLYISTTKAGLEVIMWRKNGGNLKRA